MRTAIGKALLALPLSAAILTVSAHPNTASASEAEAEESEDLSDLVTRAGELPLTLRRQTLIVRDIDRSLALYRDAIGMKVIYDETWGGTSADTGEEWTTRLVFLQASDPFISVLGLLDNEAGNPEHPSKLEPVEREGFVPGKTVTLFNTTELEERWPLIEATPGVEVLRGPTYREFPGYNDDVIKMMITVFYDPDGFLVEFNQPIGEDEGE